MSERPVAVSSGRLDMVARLVPSGARVADIGTDDAKFPIRLLDEHRASFCVASDRSGDGLTRAARWAARYVDGGRLRLRHAVGLDGVEPEDRIDVVTIAGLGARTIRDILAADRLERLGVGRLVLQPQTEIRLVREWLRRVGFGIVDERMARERERDYVVIAAEAGPVAASRWHRGDADDDLMEAGPRLIECPDPLVRSHWERELERQCRILERACGRSHRRATRRRDLARRVLARLPTDAGGLR